IVFGTQHSPTTHNNDHDAHHAGLLSDGDDIGIATFTIDRLLFLHVAQVINLITIGRGFLEFEAGRRLLHGVHQIMNNRRILTFQKHGRTANVLLIFLWSYKLYARRGTAVDLVLQAGPVSVPEIAFITGSYSENLL